MTRFMFYDELLVMTANNGKRVMSYLDFLIIIIGLNYLKFAQRQVIQTRILERMC